MLRAGQGLEELDTQQGGNRVRQHVLDGAGRCGDPKDEHQRKTLNVTAVEQRTQTLNFSAAKEMYGQVTH